MDGLFYGQYSVCCVLFVIRSFTPPASFVEVVFCLFRWLCAVAKKCGALAHIFLKPLKIKIDAYITRARGRVEGVFFCHRFIQRQ